VTQI